MAQDQTPFTPESVDKQVEDLEAALQSRPIDHPKTPDMQMIAALQEVYAADQQAHNASLQQVRERLLRESYAASQRRLHLQRPIETPGKPGKKRTIINAVPRPIAWRSGFLTRFNTLAAALVMSILVGGLVAGLILVRYGSGSSTQTGGSLKGGVEVRLQPACALQGQPCASGALARLPMERAILEHRLQDALGSSTWEVRQEGSDTIVVDLPPLKQEQEAIGLLDQTGLLEILDTGDVALTVNQPVPANDTFPVAFTGDQLDATSIQAVQDSQTGQAVVLFEFKGPARSAFASYTASHIGHYLTITFDGTVIESAAIQSQITGQGEIADTLTLDAAQHIAVLLRSGALPVPLTVVGTQTIT